MFNKKYLFSIVVASVFAVSTSANATDDEHHEHNEHHEHHGEMDHQKHGCNMISKIDVDNDGNISLKEFMTHHREMFDKADTNNDRLIDKDEMKVMMKHMHGGKNKHDGHDH